MDMFAKNSEGSFVFSGVIEFIKAWESGSKSKLTLQSKNGQAWLNFNCCLGGPHEQHQKLKKPKSKKKMERDNLRAQLHQHRLQDGLSSSNSSKTNQGEKAVSASIIIDNSDSVQVAASAIEIESVSDSSKGTEKVDRDKCLQDFKCELCEFESSQARGLNIHMSRKHSIIEQLDGFVDASLLEDEQGQKESEDEGSDIDHWDPSTSSVPFIGPLHPSTDPDFEQRTFLVRPYFKDGITDVRKRKLVGCYFETEWVRKSEPRLANDVLPFKGDHRGDTGYLYMGRWPP